MPRGLDEYGRSLIRSMCMSSEALTKQVIKDAIDELASPEFFNAERNQEFSDELKERGFMTAAQVVEQLSD
jgi:hypothetical protein